MSNPKQQLENGKYIPKIDVLVYHEKCSDGIASAWIVKKYSNNIGEILPCKAGSSIDVKKYYGKTILFVDICPPWENTSSLATNNKLIIMDHHKSAKDGFDLNGISPNIEFIFDMNRSGCQIVWDNLFEGIRPWFIDYIADRDLWKWKLPDSKFINLALFHNREINFEGLDKLMENKDEGLLNKLAEKGKMIDEIQTKELEFEESRSVVAKMCIGEVVYIVKLGTIIPYLRSDLGNRLTKKMIVDEKGVKRLPDFSAIWTYDISSSEWWISLRGHDTSPDLSVLSKKLGGGGHPKASGFTIDGKLKKKDCKNFDCDCKQDLNDYFKVVSAWWKE